jgi:glycosyltransferase involved in cell wall biosynthesis
LIAYEAMEISIVICTFDRAANLSRTLETFVPLANTDSCDWELIVVDNNSHDETKSVCEAFQDRLPLHYAFEPKQGQAAALNHAARLARGEIILFTDDDVDVDPGLLESYRQAFIAEPDAAYFGGKVRSRWQAEPPRWFVENHEWLRSNPRVDFGDETLRIDQPDTRYFIGANIAFRRIAFDEGVRFNEDQGCKERYGCRNSSHGDVNFEVQDTLLSQGKFGAYVPNAIVHHRDPANRMTEKYIRYFYTHDHIGQALRGKSPGSDHCWFGAPRHQWRKLIASVLKYFGARLFGPSRVWLGAEVHAAAAWGEIKGCRRLRQNQVLSAAPESRKKDGIT